MIEKIVSQIHIEAARNSTDDFNLFHDKNRWDWIKGNPFGGPIALGFQLGCLVEDQVTQARIQNGELAEAEKFSHSHFELNFAGVVKPGDVLDVSVKAGRLSSYNEKACFANRLLIKANGRAVLIGYKRELDSPMFSYPENLPGAKMLQGLADRTVISDTGYFLKRKYMIVGNAKNFLTSAFAQQADYIDEFADKVEFPQMYPMSLTSSALLERAQYMQHDLIAEPMIYACHKLSMHKQQLARLKSNDKLHIVVSPEQEHDGRIMHRCFGLVEEDEPLFSLQIDLLPLSAISGVA